jgi:hypothetical protein
MSSDTNENDSSENGIFIWVIAYITNLKITYHTEVILHVGRWNEIRFYFYFLKRVPIS